MRVMMLFFGAAVFLGIVRDQGGAMIVVAAACSVASLLYLGYG